MTPRSALGVLALAGALTLSACSGGTVATPTSPSSPTAPAAPPATGGPSRFTPVPAEPSVGGPTAPGTPLASVPPARWAAILTDLRGRGVDADAVRLVSAQAVTWSDGSLGCPEPGAVYTQALVPGARVVVSVAGVTYDYRFGRGDDPTLCTRPFTGGGVASDR